MGTRLLKLHALYSSAVGIDSVSVEEIDGVETGCFCLCNLTSNL